MLKYDFTKYGGPNCAIGGVNVIKVAVDTAPTPDVTTTTSTENVYAQESSDIAACIKGPAVNGGGWSLKRSDNFPAAAVSYVSGTGINETMKVNRIIDTNNGTDYSVHIANMFDYGFALRAQAHSQTNTTTYLPRIFHPYQDRGLNSLDQILLSDEFGLWYDQGSVLSGFATTQYTYEFECLDPAWEVKARIRLFVADWNTKEDFDSYATSQTTSPDRTGSETGGASPNCKYIPGIGYACNDWQDADDSLAAAFAYPNEIKR
jgi:hypothetical protein